MIHFRLRRSIRRAVRFLALRSAAFSALLYHPCCASRDLSANVSPTAHSWVSLTASPPWLLSAPVSNLHTGRRPILRNRHHLRTRRHLSSAGLAIALLLQLCGCDLVKYAAVASDPASGGDRVGDSLSAESALSFYEPADPSSISPPILNTQPDDPRSISTEAKPLPWAIPESVYFLYRSRRPNEISGEFRLHQQPLATAFVLSVPSHQPGRPIRFLVTARHVVDPQWAHCSAGDPDSIDVRLNRRSGGVEYESVPLHSGSTRNFYTPSDSTADLALIPLDQRLIPGIDNYKFIDVPFRLLPTAAETQLIHLGQAVMTAGRSPLPFGESGSYPVFDAGSLSKMPAEPVGVLCGKPQSPRSSAKLLHVWFIDAGVTQGVSGAPVYTSMARGAGAAKTPVLLGIQSVDWPDKGVAGITPSAVLVDLVQAALSRTRRDLDFYRGPNP